VRRTALALALIAGCSGGTRLDIQLVLPDQPPVTGVTQLQVVAQWSGGSSQMVVAFADGGSLSLSLPAGPIDLTVSGLLADGGAGWRGIARGVQVPGSSGHAVARVLLGPIGQFASFDGTGVMPPLAGSAAVAWGPGQVLISGGRAADGGLSSALWLYQQASIQATPLTSLEPRAHHLAAVTLDAAGNRALFLAGGEDPSGAASSTVELLADGGQHALPPLSAPQRWPAAAVAGNGLELFVGCGAGGPASVNLYLPAAALTGIAGGGLEGILPLPAPCEQGQLTWIPGLDSVLVGDVADGGFTLLGPDGGRRWGADSPVRQGFGAVAFGDGGLLQFGGEIGGVPVATFATFPLGAPSTGFTTARADFGWTTVPVNGGSVLVVGGRGGGGAPLSSAELIDLADGSSSVVPTPFNQPRIRPAVVDISGSGAALVVSGEDADGRPVGGLEIYTYP